jgi:ATP-dependent DNA helicase RecG
VEQRYALLDKGVNAGRVPHQLIISATPIPRTLAMTLYADLDLSVIDDLPPGRKEVDTLILPERRRTDVLERIRKICRDSRQVYWVCTLIDRDPQAERQAAVETATRLADQLPGLRIELAHGRMATPEKDRILREFAGGEIDVLVATTVIEVGVDAANAALIVIEDAERLGLSQLHQLRGRVGRSGHKSYCVLLYRPPLTEQARQRLAALRSCSNGFELAQLDLTIRGSGEVFGTRQAGGSGFRFADGFLDEAFVFEVRRIGDRLISEHPHQVPALIRRWLGPAGAFAAV